MLGRSASLSPERQAWVIDAGLDQGLGARAREVWQYRRILRFFAAKSVQALYKKTYLGPWWILIRTLVPIAISSFVFGSVMNVPSAGVPYYLFFMIGQVPWNCFDGPLIRGSRGIEVNRDLLTKLYVPRLILPMGQMSAGLVEPVIITLMLLASLVYYRVHDDVWYVPLRVELFACAASVLLVVLFAFSLSLWTSVWQARARDVRFAVRYALAFWMMFTPVIYPLSTVPQNLRWLMNLNPMTAPIETFRWGMLPGLEHSWAWFGYSFGITVATFAAGVWHFARTEAITMDKM
jgi:lipopolysaccharide transport system permease protein